MKIILIATAGFLPLLGQAVRTGENEFQIFEQDRARAQLLNETSGTKLVKGKPFTATEERHSLQILGDGTRIENAQSNRIYRDSEGRTRVEEMNGQIVINDPVAHLRIELDPTAKTANKQNTVTFFSNSGTKGTIYPAPFSFSYSERLTPPQSNFPAGVTSETTEKLGPQMINGVSAEGVRTSMTIPTGQIGNNRDIKIVDEQWTSSDLQMLVKSSNSDPRFGDTTYQLTKVTRTEPDPALFQIPADYTIARQSKTFFYQTPSPAPLKAPSPVR